MAAQSMVGGPNDAPSVFVLTSLVGTETINATVGAGKIGIIIDSGVVLTSLNVDTLIHRLSEAIREQVTKLA